MSTNILIAGGGVAGLEALLGLRDIAGDRVDLTLIAPEPDFTYRPMAVGEAFSRGRAQRLPLSRFTDDARARLIRASVVAVDDSARELRLDDGSTLTFDALIVATGARAVSGLEGATTWWPGGDPDVYGGLLRDVEEGYAKSLAIVVPPGSVWPLPAYELALMTAGEAWEMGQRDFVVSVVTPEPTPLGLFGEEASAALADELRDAGVQLRTGVVARADRGGLVLEPGGELLGAQRVFAVPRLVGPAIAGLPADEEGFIVADGAARVAGCERTWAAGDGVVSPVKFGALATHQARRAIAAIAQLAGVVDAPDPGEPVLHGRLLVGGGRMRRLRRESKGAPLWWPTGKVAGQHLPRWLVEHGVVPPAAPAPPRDSGVTIRRPLRDLAGPEARYVYELARRF